MPSLVYTLEYEIAPGANVAAGLPRQELLVLSPIWRGRSVAMEYPEGDIHLLVGWQDLEVAWELRVIWTRHRPEASAVCLAIGGDAGRRNLTTGQGLPFLALAESLIPREVLEVIGPRPQAEPLLLL